MARFQLNVRKAGNYAFFCPQSRLHLTVSNPVGSANEVTSAIIRGVKSGSIIDIDGVLNKTVSNQKKTESIPAETSAAVNEAPAADVNTEEKPKKNSRKKAMTEEQPEAVNETAE